MKIAKQNQTKQKRAVLNARPKTSDKKRIEKIVSTKDEKFWKGFKKFQYCN